MRATPSLGSAAVLAACLVLATPQSFADDEEPEYETALVTNYDPQTRTASRYGLCTCKPTNTVRRATCHAAGRSAGGAVEHYPSIRIPADGSLDGAAVWCAKRHCGPDCRRISVSPRRDGRYMAIATSKSGKISHQISIISGGTNSTSATKQDSTTNQDSISRGLEIGVSTCDRAEGAYGGGFYCANSTTVGGNISGTDTEMDQTTLTHGNTSTSEGSQSRSATFNAVVAIGRGTNSAIEAELDALRSCSFQADSCQVEALWQGKDGTVSEPDTDLVGRLVRARSNDGVVLEEQWKHLNRMLVAGYPPSLDALVAALKHGRLDLARLIIRQLEPWELDRDGHDAASRVVGHSNDTELLRWLRDTWGADLDRIYPSMTVSFRHRFLAAEWPRYAPDIEANSVTLHLPLTLLGQAALECNSANVTKLLALNTHPLGVIGKDPLTRPLHRFAASDCPDIHANLFGALEAKSISPQDYLNVQDARGNSVQHLAALYGTMRSFATPAADLWLTNHDGQTPAHMAARACDKAGLEHIAALGGPLDLLDNRKLRPMHMTLLPNIDRPDARSIQACSDTLDWLIEQSGIRLAAAPATLATLVRDIAAAADWSWMESVLKVLRDRGALELGHDWRQAALDAWAFAASMPAGRDWCRSHAFLARGTNGASRLYETNCMGSGVLFSDFIAQSLSLREPLSVAHWQGFIARHAERLNRTGPIPWGPWHEIVAIALPLGEPAPLPDGRPAFYLKIHRYGQVKVDLPLSHDERNWIETWPVEMFLVTAASEVAGYPHAQHCSREHSYWEPLSVDNCENFSYHGATALLRDAAAHVRNSIARQPGPVGIGSEEVASLRKIRPY